MRRVYQKRAYGSAPIRQNFWPTTVDELPPDPEAEGDINCDVVIVGGGFTGLNAAHELASAGKDVVVLEAEHIGFGASGRNGGFCCLGGDKVTQKTLIRRHGAEEAATYRKAQRVAIDHVAALLEAHGIDADTHSQGETWLAHRTKEGATLQEEAREISELWGAKAEVIPKSDLAAAGLNSPAFHGAVTTPLGFALNPAKYLHGLARVARVAGARIFAASPVAQISHEGRWTLITPKARIRSKTLVMATNGYGSDDIPTWMADRYMPAQSAILLTRPLTEDEIASQGFSSAQMCYDSRRLLHYFRLLPDRRFLFGMRGSTSASAMAARAFKRKIRHDFEAMFPAWAHVETPNYWSGFVCMTRSLTPFAGPLSTLSDAWGAFGFHGNGVSMGSYSGRLVADMILGQTARPRPAFMSATPRKFGLGRFRRFALIPPYLAYGLMDR